jgi:hypothetical protein
VNWSRLLLGVVGLAAFLLGALVVVSPSTAGLVPVGGVVEALGGPWVFAAVFAVLALVPLVTVMVARGLRGIDESTPPDPEDVYGVPAPGAAFDEFVEGRGSVRERLFGDRHARLRERLRETALATLMRTEGMSRSEARTAIEQGTWTDDPVAAAFLSDRQTPGARARLLAVVRGESSFQHGARRTAAAIADDGGVNR